MKYVLLALLITISFNSYSEESTKLNPACKASLKEYGEFRGWSRQYFWMCAIAKNKDVNECYSSVKASGSELRILNQIQFNCKKQK